MMSVNESSNAQIRELKDLMEDIKKTIKTLESKEIDSSPSLKLQSVEKMRLNKLFEAHLVCPICYEYFIYPTSLHTCGHTFCDDCIYRWKQSQREDPERIALRDTCPVCRTPIVAIARSTAFENMIETCIETWGNDCFTSSERRVAREELKTFRRQFLLQRKNEERANELQSNQSRYSNRNIYDLIFESSGDFFGIMRPRQVPATEGSDQENPVLNEVRSLDNAYTLDDVIEINPPSELHTSNDRRFSTLAIPDSTTHRQLSESGEIFYNVTRVSNMFNDVNEVSTPLSSTLERNDFQATTEPLSSTTGHNEGLTLVPEAAAIQAYADIQIDRENDGNENSSSYSSGFFNELDQQSNFIQQMVRDFDSESNENWSAPESRDAEEWPFGHLNNSIWNRYENRVQNESYSNESFQTSNQQDNSFLSLEEADDESPIPRSEQIGIYNSEQNSDTFSESNQFLDTSDWLNENAGEPDVTSFDRPETDNTLSQEILAWIERQRLENVTQSSFADNSLVDNSFDPDLIRVESRIDRSSNGNCEFVTELDKTFEHETSMNSDDENDCNGLGAMNSASDDAAADNYESENDLRTSDMINSQRRIIDIDESRSYNSNLRNDNQSGFAPLSQWSALRRPQLHLSDDWSDLEEPSDDDSRYDLT